MLLFYQIFVLVVYIFGTFAIIQMIVERAKNKPKGALTFTVCIVIFWLLYSIALFKVGAFNLIF